MSNVSADFSSALMKLGHSYFALNLAGTVKVGEAKIVKYKPKNETE